MRSRKSMSGAVGSITRSVLDGPRSNGRDAVAPARVGCATICTRGAILRRVAGPTPLTASSARRVASGRAAMIRDARTGPTPGSVSNAAASAVLTLTRSASRRINSASARGTQSAPTRKPVGGTLSCGHRRASATDRAGPQYSRSCTSKASWHRRTRLGGGVRWTLWTMNPAPTAATTRHGAQDPMRRPTSLRLTGLRGRSRRAACAGRVRRSARQQPPRS